MFDLKQHRRNMEIDVLTEGRFDSMVDVLPVGEQGVARIDHFIIGPVEMLKSMTDFFEEFLPTGRYARLRVNGQLMMTDTPMEKRTNLEVVERARGRVLIAGLGLGMILRSILKKPEVAHVTVIEKYEDVVGLVLPSLTGYSTRLDVIVDDVFKWKRPRSLPRFETIYFDIWPDSDVSLLPQMNQLHRRYRPMLSEGGWMDSWTYGMLREKYRNDSKFTRNLPALLEKHRLAQTPE